MAVAMSLLFLACGAMVTWGIGPDSAGAPLRAIGLVLLVAGGVGVVGSLAFARAWLGNDWRSS